MSPTSISRGLLTRPDRKQSHCCYHLPNTSPALVAMAMRPPPPPDARPSSAPVTKSPLSRSPTTRSPLTKSPGKSPNRSPQMKPLTTAQPAVVPEAGSLADAISKIDTLRLSHPSSAASSPPSSAPTSRRPSAVGAVMAGSLGDKKFQSPPATPHFGAQTDL